MSTVISNLLQVYHERFIQIPGCEPPSGFSSPRFAAMYSIGPCKSAYVKLEDALKAVPGSEVVFGVNFGPYGIRQKWFKLPPLNVECPCGTLPDWYYILATLEFYQDPKDPEICETECNQWDDNSYETPSSINTYFNKEDIPTHSRAALPLIPPHYR